MSKISHLIKTFSQILPFIQRTTILVSQGLISKYSVIYYILKWILEIGVKKC